MSVDFQWMESETKLSCLDYASCFGHLVGRADVDGVNTLPFTHTYSHTHTHTHSHILILHQDFFKRWAHVDIVEERYPKYS